jgi:hypothetical protein
VSVQKREGEGSLNWGQRWWMGGSHREAAEAVVLRLEPERRRGLRWREPARWMRRQWRREGGARARARSRGERRREGAGGGRWRFKSLGGAGQRGKKERGPAGAAAWQWRRRRGGPGMAVGSVGRGRCGVSATDKWGWDESRAQCQRWGAGGRGVSEAVRRLDADRWARAAQCRAA